ncbi:type VI secretion system-associated protein TagO [Oceanicola sp. 22II-s10i]|uniref:type VI secretion system-associated protein TagO n=1 Tax=Oceanicola sp. 22II-s10i TaxID=1317116 RepID=UPI000B52703B|nr:type VI secretion system-associated protein TagO [Oceanicola sp. 22II-s10i]
MPRLPVFLAAVAVILSGHAHAQSAVERHVWQDARTFEPYSRTAAAITGPITLSGNPDFASEGSTMSIAFGTAAPVQLTSVGASWRSWSVSGTGKQTAEVFRMAGDPGPLENGNRLCGMEGTDQPLYLVFHEDRDILGNAMLVMAAFEGQEPPHDINSPGLCGTYGYDAEPAAVPAVAGTATPDAAQDPAPAPSASQWRTSRETNPLDDSTTVFLALTATSGQSRWGEPITLVARCKSNKTELYVNWGDYLGDDSRDVYSEWKYVNVRVGEAPMRTEKWGVSTDRKAAFAPGWAGNFLKELLDQDRLVLQTTPYGENPSLAVFDITGLRSVLGLLAETCNWSF